MSHGRSENYIDDVPMVVSKRFQPKQFDVLTEALPVLRDRESDNYDYSFEFEHEAIEVGNKYEREAIAEVERERVRKLEEEQLFRIKAKERVEAILGPAALSNSRPSVDAVENDVANKADEPTRPPELNEVAVLRPVIGTNSHHHQSILKPISSNSLTIAANSGSDLKTTPTTAAADYKKCDKKQTNNLSINPRDFEDLPGSSPFDDALLRAIDEKEELSSVFQNVFQNGSSSSNGKTND